MEGPQVGKLAPRRSVSVFGSLAAGLLVSAAFSVPSWVPAASAQSAGQSSGADAYARLLQQIDDTRVSNARQEILLRSQGERIAALQAQRDALPQAAGQMVPVLSRFAAELEGVIEADIPFQLGERFERLGSLRELIGNDQALLAEKITRALSVANIETTYGYDITAYAGDHPTDPRRRYAACEADLDSAACALSDDLRASLDGGASLPQLDTEILDGDYVRYGRMSLAYLDVDPGGDVLIFDPQAREWRAARGSEEAGVRRNLRVARGEAAPDIIEAPVLVSQSGAESGARP